MVAKAFDNLNAASQPLLDDLALLRRRLPASVYDDMSFFEVNTLLALASFRRLGAEVDLLEVGLGGRWDSTNASDPDRSALAKVMKRAWA